MTIEILNLIIWTTVFMLVPVAQHLRAQERARRAVEELAELHPAKW